MATPTTSKYQAVRRALLARIRDLEPGTQLPTEPMLCAEFGVSRITLRHAVDGLVGSGYLIRQQGRGTFVLQPRHPVRHRERFAHAITGFHAQQSGEGAEVTTRVLELRETAAGEPSATQLGLNATDRVARLTRLRSVDGSLHHLAITDLPLARFPDIVDFDFTDASLFTHLTGVYGLDLRRNELLVTALPADESVAAHVGVERGERILAVSSTVFDDEDTAVCYGTSYFTPRHSEIAFGLRG